MFGPQDGENNVHPDGCVVHCSQSGRSLMVVKVEVDGQPSVQLTHGVILVEKDVLIFDAA